MYLPQLFISMLLFIVLFFGIGFLLNMLLRATWVMAVIYPVVVVMIVDHVKFFTYFSSPAKSFPELGQDFIHLQAVDIAILACGMIGALLSGMAIRMLRVRGYQMF